MKYKLGNSFHVMEVRAFPLVVHLILLSIMDFPSPFVHQFFTWLCGTSVRFGPQ